MVTTIVIAHRVNTIMWSDRALVMEGGRVVEFGTPAELLQSRGELSRMVCSS